MSAITSLSISMMSGPKRHFMNRSLWLFVIELGSVENMSLPRCGRMFAERIVVPLKVRKVVVRRVCRVALVWVPLEPGVGVVVSIRCAFLYGTACLLK